MTVSPQNARLVLRVAKDFSETPGPRAREEGDFSGDQFLQEVLLPRYREARSANTDLLVDLDGTEGYATSFLEAAFGGLSREFGPEEVLGTLRFKSDDEPFLVEEIKKYIRESRNQ